MSWICWCVCMLGAGKLINEKVVFSCQILVSFRNWSLGTSGTRLVGEWHVRSHLLNTDLMQPFQRVVRPRLCISCAMQAVAVTAGGIKLEFMRHFRLLKRGMIELAAGHEGLVVLTMNNQRRRDVCLQV